MTADDAAISRFMSWCVDDHTTNDVIKPSLRHRQLLTVDEYVDSLQLADWLGAESYLSHLLGGLQGRVREVLGRAWGAARRRGAKVSSARFFR